MLGPTGLFLLLQGPQDDIHTPVMVECITKKSQPFYLELLATQNTNSRNGLEIFQGSYLFCPT
jgi:hypothetical protein